MRKISPVVRGAAMFFAALTLGFATVSCEDEFDDSELNSRIDDLEDSVSSLESRVAALESAVSSMNSQISSLSSMINGLVTVSSVTANTDGSYTIELSDGTTFDVPAPAEEEEPGTVPVVGIATDADGDYYWTLDGEPLYDADGNLIYLVQDNTTEVITPLFKVSETTGELEISVDNGGTYTSTGVVLISDSGSEVETPSCSCITIFTAFSYDSKYAYFTLADGTVVPVALNASASEVNCVALSGKQYFQYGDTKTVKLSVSGISKATVTRPDGWKASVSGAELTITAPSATSDFAETEGTVTVIAVASDGRAAIADVNVAIGQAPVTIALAENEDATNVTIDYVLNAEADENINSYLYGVVKVASLSDFDPRAIYDEWANTNSYMLVYSICEENLSTSLVDELSWNSETFEEGYSYIVYAIGCYVEGWDCSLGDYEDMVYEVYQPVSIELEILSKTFEDATIKITANGISDVYYYLESEEYYDLDYYINNINTYYAGSRQSLATGYEGSLCDFDIEYYTYYGLDYGAKYILAFLPYEEGKYDYTTDDVIAEFVIQLDPLSYDGTAVAQIGEVTATTTSVSAKVTPGDDVYIYYAAYLTEANYMIYSAGATEDFINYLKTYGATREAGQTYTMSRSSLNPATVGYICSVALDANGAYGPIQAVEATTEALVFNETIKVTAEATDLSSTSSAVISWSVEGGDVTSYRYLNLSNSAWTTGSNYGKGDEATTETFLATSGNYMIKKNITETTATVTGLSIGTQYEFFILGFDSDDNPTHMCHLTYEAGSGIVIIRSTGEDGSTNPDYINVDLSDAEIQYRTWDDSAYYSLPTARGEWETLWNSDGGYFRIYIDFTNLPSTVQTVAVRIDNPEYCSGTWKVKTQNVISNGKTATKTGWVESGGQYFYKETNVFYTWQDTAGKWYECKEFNVYEKSSSASEE